LDGWENYIDPEMEPVLAAALSYAEQRNWYVFPADISFDEATGKFNKKSYKAAKHSNGAKWGKTRDPEQIRKDFRKWPEANVGLPTGKDNGFWVLEADTLKGHNVDGIASLRMLTIISIGRKDSISGTPHQRLPPASTYVGKAAW
jgi:hypothetical protein